MLSCFTPEEDEDEDVYFKKLNFQFVWSKEIKSVEDEERKVVRLGTTVLKVFSTVTDGGLCEGRKGVGRDPCARITLFQVRTI